jgi:hypothetical protein
MPYGYGGQELPDDPIESDSGQQNPQRPPSATKPVSNNDPVLVRRKLTPSQVSNGGLLTRKKEAKHSQHASVHHHHVTNRRHARLILDIALPVMWRPKISYLYLSPNLARPTGVLRFWYVRLSSRLDRCLLICGGRVVSLHRETP